MGQDAQAVGQFADDVAKASDCLMTALESETALKHKGDDALQDEVQAAQTSSEGCAEEYLKAMRRYVQCFQASTGEGE